MHLAKFFHLPSEDRLLHLSVDWAGRWSLAGTVLKTGAPFVDERYGDGLTAVGDFLAAAATLRAHGFVETADTNYTLRKLPPDPEPKLGWRIALEDAVALALVSDDASLGTRLAVLAAAAPRDEPLHLWVAASHHFATLRDADGALRLANEARAQFDRRRDTAAPLYVWSLSVGECEALIWDLTAEIHHARADFTAALRALRDAGEASGGIARSARLAAFICAHFPQYQEDAFDVVERYAEFGGYEAVTRLPAYGDYLRRRAGIAASPRPRFRWAFLREPAGEDDIRGAETQLGTPLPGAYRSFLGRFGHTDLVVQCGPKTSWLHFHPPRRLARERHDFERFISRVTPLAKVEEHFRRSYGVSARHLLPVAGPHDISSDLLIHVEPGSRFGHCFLWSHDDAFVLEHPWPDFSAALGAIVQGIDAGDPAILGFFDLG